MRNLICLARKRFSPDNSIGGDLGAIAAFAPSPSSDKDFFVAYGPIATNDDGNSEIQVFQYIVSCLQGIY